MYQIPMGQLTVQVAAEHRLTNDASFVSVTAHQTGETRIKPVFVGTKWGTVKNATTIRLNFGITTLSNTRQVIAESIDKMDNDKKVDDIVLHQITDVEEMKAWCEHLQDDPEFKGVLVHFDKEDNEEKSVLMSFDVFACLFHFAEKGGMAVTDLEDESDD